MSHKGIPQVSEQQRAAVQKFWQAFNRWDQDYYKLQGLSQLNTALYELVHAVAAIEQAAHVQSLENLLNTMSRRVHAPDSYTLLAMGYSQKESKIYTAGIRLGTEATVALLAHEVGKLGVPVKLPIP